MGSRGRDGSRGYQRRSRIGSGGGNHHPTPLLAQLGLEAPNQEVSPPPENKTPYSHTPLSRLRRIDQRWKELAAFMHSSVEIRSAEVAESPDLVNERGDVFTRLVAANENDGKYALSADEVVRQLASNLFPLPRHA